MKHLLAFLFSTALFFSLSAQTSSDIGIWVDHLPYSRAIDVVQGEENLVYVAARQGLFAYNNLEKTIQRISKVNGLSEVGLTCLAWSESQQLLVIGYENGNLDLLQGEQVINVPDIKVSGSFTGLKRINYIHIEDNLAYICTNFGIVTYDLDRRFVVEQFIIGNDGNTLAVNDLAVSPDSLYAATPEGLKTVSRNNLLIFFDSWKVDSAFPGDVDLVTWFDGKVYANKFSSSVSDSVFFKEQGKWKWASFIDIGNNLDLNATNGYLVVVNAFSARSYDSQFQLNQNFIFVGDDAVLSPTSAVVSQPNQIFIADQNFGLVEGFEIFSLPHTPNGPATPSVFKISQIGERMYVAPGGLSDVWAPVFNNDGYFYFDEFNWVNQPNGRYGGNKDIVAFVADPTNPLHVYASSYGNGVLEFQDTSFVQLLNTQSTNGAIPPVSGGAEHRIGDFATSPEGDIWFTNSLTDRPLGVIRPDGTIESFSLGSVASSATAIKDIMFTSQNQIWIQTRGQGVVVTKISEDGEVESSRKLTSTEGSGNLPTNSVLTFAEDQDGEIWIGTNEGIAVLFSPQNIFEPNRNFDANIIVIDEDGDSAGERVLGSEIINDIEVDGSNKKWFATASSGVFYSSANGKQQLKHFTRANSPLPSDNVLDIEIDDLTGMVYFGTDQGVVSYQGAATQGVETHEDVFAYPNPVEPGYSGPILIRGLVTNAQVKITDVEGNIVFETVAEGGQAIWSGNKFNGERVRSGVYLAYITSDLGGETAVAKILVVN